ncbi:MAG TPA: hemerythrin domain-containing protein [Vicinamibacterales bacterium]|nr:hemerythrin domain-containing protein [Vicinamibacterales bacterium]
MKIIVIGVGLLLAGAFPQHEHQAAGTAKGLAIPSAVTAEHHHLMAALEEAVTVPGAVGQAAEGVKRVLQPHFASEEEYALPPLAALAPLAAGKPSPDDKATMEKAKWLKDNMPRMMAEHKTIVEALDKLEAAARAENKPAQVEFVEMLKQHATFEEQIMYPAAILVGEYLQAAHARH